MFLQAFIDDSASEIGERRYYLAGYINTAERWEFFTRAWQSVLEEEPVITAFHAVDAQNLKGDFRGWSAAQRTRKVLKLAKVIHDSNPWSFETYLSRTALEQAYAEKCPHVLAHPFQTAFWGALFVVRNLHEHLGLKSPVEFIFDEQNGQSRFATIALDMALDEHPDLSKILSGLPIFRKDTEILPLQAADMLAWHVRRNAESRDAPGSRTALNLLVGNHASMPVTPDALSGMAEKMAKIPGWALNPDKASSRRLRREFEEKWATGERPVDFEEMQKQMGLRPDGEPTLFTRLRWRLLGPPAWARKHFRGRF